MKAPPTTKEFITFRFVENLRHLEIGPNRPVTRLEAFTSTSISSDSLTKSDLILAFIIPAGAQLIPFVYRPGMEEDEVLLPHGTRIVYQGAIKIGRELDLIAQPRAPTSEPPIKDNNGYSFIDSQHRYNTYCSPVLVGNIYIFRVVHDPWEVQAALNYNPLNYNLYGSCLDSVSQETGASIERIKRLAEQHLFHL